MSVYLQIVTSYNRWRQGMRKRQRKARSACSEGIFTSMDGAQPIDSGPERAQRTLHPIELGLQILCGFLKLPPERVLRRAGLDETLHLQENARVAAPDYFAFWDATMAEAAPDPAMRAPLLLKLSDMFARGPFVPAILAYACAPTVAVGARRMKRYKPLVGPTTMELDFGERGMSVRHRSEDPAAARPDSLVTFHAIIFVELARVFAAEPVKPLAVALPGGYATDPVLIDYFGVRPEEADEDLILLSHQDAERRLLSENAALWASLEPDLDTQLAGRERDAPIEARVRGALLELLPRGLATAEAVSSRLKLGKRSLQRRLAEIGQSFQSLLDETRKDLALHYLQRSGRTIEEISYLLAYRDPNSFYRAFHGWTGMTPMQARRGAAAQRRAAVG